MTLAHVWNRTKQKQKTLFGLDQSKWNIGLPWCKYTFSDLGVLFTTTNVSQI